MEIAAFGGAVSALGFSAPGAWCAAAFFLMLMAFRKELVTPSDDHPAAGAANAAMRPHAAQCIRKRTRGRLCFL